MSEIHWIKLKTNLFDDEKIKLIEAMPEADFIIVIWIKLLLQAGKCNSSGGLMLFSDKPYSVEMLATIFNRPLPKVKVALKILRDLNLIEVTERNVIIIKNWEKHQNIMGLDKIREQNRLRQQRFRDSKKTLESGKTEGKEEEHNVTSHPNNALDTDTDTDTDTDKRKEYNNKKHKYGTHKNVFLTDEEVEKLKEKFNSKFEDKINNLSEGLALKGYVYKSHYLAILNWDRREKEKELKLGLDNPTKINRLTDEDFQRGKYAKFYK